MVEFVRTAPPCSSLREISLPVTGLHLRPKYVFKIASQNDVHFSLAATDKLADGLQWLASPIARMHGGS